MNKLKRFWFKCEYVKTKTITKKYIIAKSLEDAEEQLKKSKDIVIPLEYLRWEEIKNG